eukprot:COSAG02_NODE_83_length_39665_cov_25.213719_12_plen_360_part_00
MPLRGIAQFRRAVALASVGTSAVGCTVTAGAWSAASCQAPNMSTAEVTDRPSSSSRGQELLAECNERLARLASHFATAPPGSSGTGAAPSAASAAFEINTDGFKRKVRLVTFDLDDTLWDTWSVLTRAHQVKQEYMERHYPRITKKWDLTATRKHNTDVRNARPDLAHSFAASHREAIRLQAAAAGYDEASAVDDIYGAFAVARNDVTLYDDALEMLSSLKEKGLIIGTITNGNADATKIRGLCDVISFAVDAHQAGAAKPNPAVFHLALARAAEVGDGSFIEPDECVHVGDDLTSDVLGAQRVGFRTIHFLPDSRRAKALTADREANSQGVREPPDATVATLAAIVDVLAEWDAGLQP